MVFNKLIVGTKKNDLFRKKTFSLIFGYRTYEIKMPFFFYGSKKVVNLSFYIFHYIQTMHIFHCASGNFKKPLVTEFFADTLGSRAA